MDNKLIAANGLFYNCSCKHHITYMIKQGKGFYTGYLGQLHTHYDSEI